MTTKPCPTCRGMCCVNKYGNPADHGSALALHSCPKCDNGRVEISPEDQERVGHPVTIGGSRVRFVVEVATRLPWTESTAHRPSAPGPGAQRRRRATDR